MRPFIKTLALTILLTFFGVRTSFGSDVVLVGARIYPSPSDRPIKQGSILIHDGRIAEVGPAASVKAPRNATVIDCKGLVITAGFWNSHVHILTPGLIHADNSPLTKQRRNCRRCLRSGALQLLSATSVQCQGGDPAWRALFFVDSI
jgi:N-acetylglucosamine-6-phosphate deacetylase